MASAARLLSIPLPNGSRISIPLALPFIAIHFLALGVFFVKFRWAYLATCLGLVAVRMFFVTAGYHRYFSHRSYKTSRAFQFFIAFMAMTSTQKGVLWWAAHHRHHHRFSDQEDDLHSPTLFGFLWSHIGWIVSDKYEDTRLNYIGDFAKIPRTAQAEQVSRRPAGSAWSGPMADRWMAALRLGLLLEHRAAVARHLYDQFALAPVRFPSL
jgi:fatty-acid desaturase